jgi:hypothetical protein
VFFDTEELVHYEYVPQGQTVNKEFYKTVLQYICDAVHRHRPENWQLDPAAYRSVTTNEFW